MTRDDIIRMARECGVNTELDTLTCYGGFFEVFEQFAALVAAAEREKVAAWMIQRGYATGHGDTTEDLLKELDWQVLANWSSAMKTGAENEREACAKVADDTDPVWYSIGAAIRARGKTK